MQIIKFLLLKFVGLRALNLLGEFGNRVGTSDQMAHTAGGSYNYNNYYDQIRKKSRPFYMPSHSQFSFLLQKGRADQDSATLQYLPVSLMQDSHKIYTVCLVEMTCNNKNAIRYQGNLML